MLKKALNSSKTYKCCPDLFPEAIEKKDLKININGYQLYY